MHPHASVGVLIVLACASSVLGTINIVSVIKKLLTTQKSLVLIRSSNINFSTHTAAARSSAPAPAPSSRTHTPTPQWWYVSGGADSKRVTRRSDALVDLDGDVVCVRVGWDVHSGVSGAPVGVSRHDGDGVPRGWLSYDSAPDTCPPLTSSHRLPTHASAHPSVHAPVDEHAHVPSPSLPLQGLPLAPIPTPTPAPLSHQPLAAAHVQTQLHKSAHAHAQHLHVRVHQQHLPVHVHAHQQQQAPIAADFDVYMLLDHCETVKKSNNMTLVDMLTKAGIRVRTEALGVGDVTWVARPRVAHGYALRSLVIFFLV